MTDRLRSILSVFGININRNLSNRNWTAYWLADHPGTDLPMDVLKVFIAPDSLSVVTDLRHINREIPFIYIGHGDSSGAFAADRPREGIGRRHLVEPQSVEHWKTGPLIWWCCFSAQWLASLGRQDWIGFSDFIGYDARQGQKQWWRTQIEGLIGKIVTVAEKRSNMDLISSECSEIYKRAREGYTVNKSVSYSTVVLARLMRDNLKMGKEFGS